MPFQWMDPCVAMGAWEVLMVWMLAASIVVLTWPLVQRLSPAMRRRLIVGVVVVGSLFGATPAFATTVGSGCQWMNAQEWPCWMIEALWCPCTWDDEAGGGGSGAGGEDPPIPPG